MWLMTNTPATACPGGEARYDRGFVKTGQVTPDLYGQSHLIRLLILRLPAGAAPCHLYKVRDMGLLLNF